ncbi:MAG: LysR family transcriptional regulator [Pseudomonas sp.]
MKIDEIQAFVSVVQCQSLSVAAETLSLAQPALTRRVQNFEESMGVELLDRSTKPLRPNPTGLRVYEQCRAVLRQVEQLRALVSDDAEPSGPLRLGVPQSTGELFLLNALHELRDAHPELNIRVSTGWGSVLGTRLENGELDAAAVLAPASAAFPDGVVSVALTKMQLHVVAARGSVPARPQPLGEIQQHGWVLNPDGCGFRAGLQRALADLGLPLVINMETFGVELQLGLVADGLGLGLVPAPMLQHSRYRDRLEVIAVRDFKPATQLWLLHQPFLGNLQRPVEAFGHTLAQRFGTIGPVVQPQRRSS